MSLLGLYPKETRDNFRIMLTELYKLGFLAGRQSIAEEIEGEMPAELEIGTPRGNQDESTIGHNECRAQVLEIIKRLKNIGRS